VSRYRAALARAAEARRSATRRLASSERWLLADASMSNQVVCRLDHSPREPRGDPALVAFLLLLFVILTAVNQGNNLFVRPTNRDVRRLLRLRPLRPRRNAEAERHLPASIEAAPESVRTEPTADSSSGEIETRQAIPGIDGEVIELDDLSAEPPDYSASSPPSPCEVRAPQRTRRRSSSGSKRGSEATTTGSATSHESLPPSPTSQPPFFSAPLRRRRPNDTESRGSEAHRIGPNEPYFSRRRAASVPALPTGTEDN